MIHCPTIHTHGIESYFYVGNPNAAASATFPTANLALFWPIRIWTLYTARMLWCANGTVVSGNIDMGIYDNQGTRLVSIGSTAQSGTSALQSFDITDTPLLPGSYFLAVSLDNTTGTLFRTTQIGRTSAIAGPSYRQLTAFPLPATATVIQSTVNYFPLIGMTNRTFV